VRRKEARLAGFGGQGIILAGLALGRAAALYDGKHAVVTQSFGPEARGGACAAEVVISDEPVDYPRVADPDLLVVLSQEALSLYGGDHMPRDGWSLMLYDLDLVALPEGEKRRAVGVPFTATAEKLGNKLATNTVMLGAICGSTSFVSPEAVKRAISDMLPKKVVKLNMTAFDQGVALGQAGRGSSK
jgi:2-oxoglutarate ferredoxin oxidoreductase subunit gamma